MSAPGRAERLRLFLIQGMRESFVWGANDCCLWACNWIAAERGVDPAVALRGTYSSEAECAALVAARGGLEKLASDLGSAAGLTAATLPAVGDVALVQTGIGPALMLITGIMTEPSGIYCAWKSARGIVNAAGVTPLKAWTV